MEEELLCALVDLRTLDRHERPRDCEVNYCVDNFCLAAETASPSSVALWAPTDKLGRGVVPFGVQGALATRTVSLEDQITLKVESPRSGTEGNPSSLDVVPALVRHFKIHVHYGCL